MGKRLCKYTLYTAGPGLSIVSRSKQYHSGMWIVWVMAKSIKHAYFLLANQISVNENSSMGICQIDNSFGPDVGWPWQDGVPYPKHWRSG